MSVRDIAILLAGALALVYVAILVVLFVNQRSFLFFGGRHETAMNSVYHATRIVEPDGVALTIWEASPAAASSPVIIFFYGNAGTLTDFSDIGEMLHREGYGIVLASYRGYSGNPGIPTEEGLMNDARAILGALPDDHGLIILWGQSLGSGVAARMASEGRANALILQSPYTAVVDVAARRFPIFPVRWLMKDKFNTSALVPKIKVPVLIMHGMTDDVVPFDMGVTLSRRFGSRATFVAIPNRGHNDLGTGDLLPVANGWLKDHVAWTHN